MQYCEHACSGQEFPENVGILYLGPGTHVRAPLVTLIKQIGVVLEGETGYFQFLLISLLAVFIQGRKVAIHGSPCTTGTRFCQPRGVTCTSNRTCLAGRTSRISRCEFSLKLCTCILIAHCVLTMVHFLSLDCLFLSLLHRPFLVARSSISRCPIVHFSSLDRPLIIEQNKISHQRLCVPATKRRQLCVLATKWRRLNGGD